MRRLLLLVAAAALVTGALASCADRSVRTDEGRDALLQVSGAQFFRETLPADATGPKVRSLTLSPIVRPGSSDRKCSGELEGPSTAVAIALEGDVGYWIVPAGLPDIAAPGLPTFGVSVAFASNLPNGTRNVVARAVDAQGHFGPATTRPVTVAGAGLPPGRLVVNLSWGNAADLDLHVVDPRGVEIWKRNINSYEPPGPGQPPEKPNTPHDGGILDFDSNAQCVPDGRRAENVVWTDPPPSGHYLVRVDTVSLCGEVAAGWRVEAVLDGRTLGSARGTGTENDTRFPHDRGAGVLALEFDVP